MKKIFTTILLVFSTIISFAQENFYIYKTDGTVVSYVISAVDSIGFVAPSAENPEPPIVTKVLTFEDEDAKFSSYNLDYCSTEVNTWSDIIPAKEEQAYMASTLIYGTTGTDAPYTWIDENNTGLWHTFPYNWGGYAFSGGGIVVSNMLTTLEDMQTDYDIYNHQLSIINESGANGSDNFAIVYNDSQVDTEVKSTLSFSDNEAHTIKSMYVTIPAITLYCMLNGNDFSSAYGEDDFLKIVAIGTDKDGNTQIAEIMLAEGADVSTWAVDWTKWDLSSLGEVVSVSFHMEEAQIDDYGHVKYYKTPLYFAFDDVEVQ